MRRFFLIVLDGCGVGELPDALEYGAGDLGSNTLANTATVVGGLRLPHLEHLGLGNIAEIAGVAATPDAPSHWGRLAEISKGKDTVTGHWEMMGVTTDPAFPTYPDGFPAELIAAYEAAIGTKTIGHFPASGTEILKQLGEEHLRTGFPIVYTSADSVFQVAAHETHFGLERLYAICEVARKALSVGRVIARPFVGESAESFKRTENRRDWPLPPPHRTTLDTLTDAGKRVHFIGKTCELFPDAPGQRRELTTSNPAHCAALAQAVAHSDADFIFANLEDFDMLYGHRNDPIGFARLLEDFDAWLGEHFLPLLRPDDLVGVTADHGNDPTTPSTDHSREYAPLLLFGPSITAPQNLGEVPGFSWWSQTLLAWLGVSPSTQSG
jgi:phosphopentomutase